MLLTLLAYLTGETSNAVDFYKTVDVDTAKELLDNSDGYTLIDVRSPSEYNEDHIPGAHLIPCDELETRINELNANSRYILICKSGNRSSKACNILAAHGFHGMINVDGGMEKWCQEIENRK